VVGGFIEQNQVWLLEQNFSQFDPHAPSATEFTGWTGKIFTQKTEADQNFLNLSIVVNFFDGIEFFAEGRNFLNQIIVFGRFIIGP